MQFCACSCFTIMMKTLSIFKTWSAQIMLGTSPATAPFEFGLDLLSSLNRSQYVLEALQTGYPTASTFVFIQADFEHEITVNIPVFFTTVSGNITDYQVAPNTIGASIYFINHNDYYAILVFCHEFYSDKHGSFLKSCHSNPKCS